MDTNSISHKMGIYIILNTQNNKGYVGQAKNIRLRWQKHEMALRGNYHKNRHLQAAWNKYGESVFDFYVLEYCSSDKMNEREVYYISLYKTCGLSYNATNGGDGASGYKHTIETRIRLSEMKKGKTASLETRAKQSAIRKGKTSSMKGKHHSEETRQMLSEIGKGRVASDEAKLNMSKAQKGHPVGLKVRQAVSKAQKGKIESKETRLKKSLSHKGMKRSSEAVEKTAEKQRKAYIVTSPNGIEQKINGLSKFCREHNLFTSTMSRVAQGRRNHCKGWKCRYA